MKIYVSTVRQACEESRGECILEKNKIKKFFQQKIHEIIGGWGEGEEKIVKSHHRYRSLIWP